MSAFSVLHWDENIGKTGTSWKLDKFCNNFLLLLLYQNMALVYIQLF
jgi:hypothetical protein